jgi:hypothetical protein
MEDNDKINTQNGYPLFLFSYSVFALCAGRGFAVVGRE